MSYKCVQEELASRSPLTHIFKSEDYVLRSLHKHVIITGVFYNFSFHLEEFREVQRGEVENN